MPFIGYQLDVLPPLIVLQCFSTSGNLFDCRTLFAIYRRHDYLELSVAGVPHWQLISNNHNVGKTPHFKPYSIRVIDAIPFFSRRESFEDTDAISAKPPNLNCRCCWRYSHRFTVNFTTCQYCVPMDFESTSPNTHRRHIGMIAYTISRSTGIYTSLHQFYWTSCQKATHDNPGWLS